MAASLATNFFSDVVSVVDIIDQSSLVRLVSGFSTNIKMRDCCCFVVLTFLLCQSQSQCLVKVGAHVAAAVLYQCFMPEEFKYGLRILRLAPESHDEAFFQHFWEVSFVEY